jgi:uncharacterized protein
MPKSKPSRKPARSTQSNAAAQPPTVSVVWLITVLGSVVVGSVFLAWVALCFVFWQGSWQLLYHPTFKLSRTPASVGIAFDPIGLATTQAGVQRLSGWWIPAARGAPFANITVLYLHGATGNLSNTVDDLQRLHAAGLTVLAIDYRGYGRSEFVHPSEARFLQDTNWALQYLTGTRYAAPGSILLVGQGLGANLAVEVASAHPKLAGVVLEDPLPDPTSAIFRDPRAHVVPAHWLVDDRWDLNAAASHLQTPALWLAPRHAAGNAPPVHTPAAFQKISGPKSLVWTVSSANSDADFTRIVDAWLRDLPNHGRNFPTCQLSNGAPC